MQISLIDTALDKRLGRFFEGWQYSLCFGIVHVDAVQKIRWYIYFLFLHFQFRSNRKSVKPNSRRTSVQLKIDDLSGNFSFALYFCLDVLMSCLAFHCYSL